MSKLTFDDLASNETTELDRQELKKVVGGDKYVFLPFAFNVAYPFAFGSGGGGGGNGHGNGYGHYK
jgi:hypothetical protein